MCAFKLAVRENAWSHWTHFLLSSQYAVKCVLKKYVYEEVKSHRLHFFINWTLSLFIKGGCKCPKIGGSKCPKIGGCKSPKIGRSKCPKIGGSKCPRGKCTTTFLCTLESMPSVQITGETEHLSDCPNLGETNRSSAQFCVDQWELSPELGHSERQLKEKKSWRKEKKSPSQPLKSEEKASKTYPEVSSHMWEG